MCAHSVPYFLSHLIRDARLPLRENCLYAFVILKASHEPEVARQERAHSEWDHLRMFY